jgi:hypothetical protein
MPLRWALDTLVIDLPIGYLEGNSPDDFTPRATVRFIVRLAFIRRFKDILDKLSRRLNKEHIKIFIIIIIIIIVFKLSLIWSE